MNNDVLIPANGTASVVDYIIRIGGEELPATFMVRSIVVSKEINRIARAKIILLDGDVAEGDFPLSNEELMLPGGEIEVLAGFESDEQLLFKGVIVKHSIKTRANAYSQLRLDCMDPSFKMTINRKNRYFTEITDTEAIEDIIAEYEGITGEIDLSEISHKELVQFESTDWAFLISRAEANGKLCFVSDGNLNIKAPDYSLDPVLTLTYGATLLEFDAEMDARDQYPAVKAFSWDYTNQELLEVEGSDPGIEEQGNFSAADLAAISGLESFDLRHSGQVVEEELQAWADACLLKSRMAKIRGRAKFQGFAGVLPGDTVLLQGVGDRFNGKSYVSAVRHEIQNGDWLTDIQLGHKPEWYMQEKNTSSPALGLLPCIQGLQIGTVTQLGEDPEGENRILVKVPVISTEEEGVWARVATLDAGLGDGAGRGSFFLPEIEDEVIVGFLNGDPRDPVVLGMLHSSAKPAPLEASDDNHEKGFVSRSDMKLMFNDDKISLQIETPAGKKIALDEDAGELLLADENGNKIVLNSDGITIESGGTLTLKASSNLKAEGGANLELSAGASLKASGSAGAELTTSAVAKIEGSLVTIN
ncbi:MAG: type VI secretion system tip protein VgrG [Bacteroidota bacterium]